MLIKPQIITAKLILETLDVSELRLIEDYAQRLRLRLQDENLKQLIDEEIKI